MTVRQIIEDIKGHFPNLGETEIMLEFNRVYKDFCARTRLYTARVDWTTSSSPTALSESTVRYALPSDVGQVYRVDMLSSGGLDVAIYDRPQFSIEHGYITFFDKDGEVVTTFPTGTVATVRINYRKIPTSITAETATIAIDTKWTEYIIAGVLRKLYSKYPTIPFSAPGGTQPVMVRDWQAVKYNSQFYKEGILEGIKEANMQQDTTAWAVQLIDFNENNISEEET